jgi:tetratricopeptide (TPR) repeat protein
VDGAADAPIESVPPPPVSRRPADLSSEEASQNRHEVPTIDTDDAAFPSTEFETWDEESVTTIHPAHADQMDGPPHDEPVPDASIEYGSTTLDELGVSDEDELDQEPIRVSPSTGSDRPAAVHLGDKRMTAAWVARAEWFEAEAHTSPDSNARARLLLAAGELWAMAGNLLRARDATRRAVHAAPTLAIAGRQARWLAGVEGDWKAVASALDPESRAATSEAARAHALYLSAEVHRLALKDAQGAEKRLDQLIRAAPGDARAYVTKLALELSESTGAPKMKWPDAMELSPLSSATADLARLRGGTHPQSGTRVPAVAFEDARRAVAAADRAAAGVALAELGGVPGIGDGALLLAAALFAPTRETRPLAIEALSDLLDRNPSRPVRRALAARALEQGDSTAMNRALSDPDGQESAFGPVDRVALSALAGGDPEALTRAALELVGDDTLRPLAAGAASAGSASTSMPVGDPAMRASLGLGRRLGGVKAPEELKDSVHAFRAAVPESPLGRILALELDAAAGATSAVAAEAARLMPTDDAKSGRLAAGLIEEVAGHIEIARRNYASAVGTGTVAEAAARALLSPGATNAGDLLATLAGMLGDEPTPRLALLLYEAAIRGGLEDAQAAEDLLTRAHDAAPELPLAARLCVDLARSRGDIQKLLGWIRRQREATRDPLSRAQALVRETLLVADEDADGAMSLLSQAVEACPDDVALRELGERLNAIVPQERAAWRERIAQRSEQPRIKAWLLLEAAREHERLGAFEDAARCAWEAADAGSELARVAAERLLPSKPEPGPVGIAAERASEHELIGSTKTDEMQALANRLVDLPDRGEAVAHARLALRLQLKNEPWETGRELVERASRFAPQSIWVLRQSSAYARVAGEDLRQFEADRELVNRVPRPLDAGALALRAAEIACRLGKNDEALTLLERALSAAPDHLVALSLRAEIRASTGNARGAAEDLEAVAVACAVRDYAWENWYRAAVLWLDKAGDPDRGLVALERAAAIDVVQEDVFDRLQLLYVQRGDRQKLAELLEQRLAQTNDPDEKIALEVTRGRALADIGDLDAARKALGAALEANPDHLDALEAYASLCALEGDLTAAEEAWIRLARIATEPAKQAEVYRKLAQVYEGGLSNPERAELSYREVLKRKPDDTPAKLALVRVLARLGATDKAVALQTELVDAATDPQEKREHTIELARVVDEGAKDKKAAFAILDKARKAWPHDGTLLKALAEHHRRHGETGAVNVLLDRSSAEARRALTHGRFDASFFSVLSAVAEVREQADAANVAKATLEALEGREGSVVQGAGAAAAHADLDDLLAPDVFTPAFRTLLTKLPGVLDTAYPVDLKALRAAPPAAEFAELASEMRVVAESVGLPSLEILASPALGPVFLPVSSAPPCVVVGQALFESEEHAARYFAFFRVLKILKTHSAAFVRIAPIELMPATAALLSLVAKGFSPQGVDAGRLADARRRIEAALPSRLGDDTATLALDVGGNLGNKASQLGQAVGSWGSRAALLAVGSPSIALRGIALALGQADGPPTDLTERLKWVMRVPEARDLAVFSVSEGYADARRRVGLAD